MEKKYRIVSNYTNEGYSLVIRCFELNGEGKRVNVQNKTFTGLSKTEMFDKIKALENGNI